MAAANAGDIAAVPAANAGDGAAVPAANAEDIPAAQRRLMRQSMAASIDQQVTDRRQQIATLKQQIKQHAKEVKKLQRRKQRMLQASARLTVEDLQHLLVVRQS